MRAGAMKAQNERVVLRCDLFLSFTLVSGFWWVTDTLLLLKEFPLLQLPVKFASALCCRIRNRAGCIMP